MAEKLLSQREKYIKRNLDISKNNLNMLFKWVKNNEKIISWTPPKSGFTAFPEYEMDINSTEFCKQLLKDEKVMLSPGDQFGMDKHLRINIGARKEAFQEALKQIQRFVDKL